MNGSFRHRRQHRRRVMTIAIRATAKGMFRGAGCIIIDDQFFTDSGITRVDLCHVGACRQLVGQIMAGASVSHADLQNKESQDHDA